MSVKGRRALERENGELNTRLDLSHIMIEQLKEVNKNLVGKIDDICQKSLIKGLVNYFKLRKLYFKKKWDKDN